MRKSGFWTFCLAFWPGAGQMYQDYMKRGISIMGLFGLEIVLLSTFGSALFSMMMLVTWCAAFFDTFHLARMDAAARADDPDEWLWNAFGDIGFAPGRNVALGAVCIVLGAWLCLEQLPRLLGEFGLRVYWLTAMIERYLPPLFLAAVLIWLGLRLVMGDGHTLFKPPVNMEDWMPFEQPSAVDAADMDAGDGIAAVPAQPDGAQAPGAAKGVDAGE